MAWKRQSCLRVGSRLPGWLASGSLALAETLEMGRWLSSSGYICKSYAPNRGALFEAVARQIENKVVLYLEFGVWRGESMKAWSALLKNSESSLHGFDSFVGLPEDWIPGIQKGHFSTDGNAPTLADPRVRFYKGWFHETLPGYVLPPHDVMVVNVDSDLYLPARYVLDFLAPQIRQGDFMYFDEFHIPHDEVRAFREFTRNTGLVFSLFGATKGFAGAVFKCEESSPAVASELPSK
jgi:hypothetical protein